LATACAQGKRTQHGKPQGVGSDAQPDAREGQAGRPGVAERFAQRLCGATSGYGSIGWYSLEGWLPLPFDAADLGAFQGQIVH
jgi:hypothetical protein